MSDLFIALGYEVPRLNIHKSGREIDLSSDHRLEARRAVAECKATGDPIGGGDLNKFVGALDAEHLDETPVTGYFVSLSGFTETAVEQELRRQRTKIITLTGTQVVDEMVRGRILIDKSRATELAGRHCAGRDDLVLDPSVDLLAHERGWVWSVYYTEGKARTHFALIHSDGTPLARAIADEVIASDRYCGGELHALSCLNPAPTADLGTMPDATDALSAYRHYLEQECGYIQLDGLPADSDVGSRRLRLENLFVPLHLDVEVAKNTTERKPVGAVVDENPRMAILAAPGGGKSTLIKRLAVAYINPSRREQIADGLSEKDWLPLFFRCRELRGLARGSFADLVDAIAHREPVRQHAEIFRDHVDRALLAGKVLLLVDGLDEISDPGDRAAFVCTLRAALQAYQGIALIVTSREAGFRHVASHLAPVCIQTKLSSLDESDIQRLTVAWHREVIGDSDKVRSDAEQLAKTITLNDRISRLTTNPLLLTTLLLVKRWVGSLPTRRSVLYGKAVEVLLMTWNTEGHEPIPEEEALPQLCFVASAMMFEGVQKVSRPRLITLLQQARASLPTELGYVKGTVDEFIHRVEDRSSLLMMTGLDVENGRLVEFFEFRHLTFQEFLTARAVVEGWHPGRNETDTIVSVLQSHFEDEQWREVIPLAAVLGGRSSEVLIQQLTRDVTAIHPDQAYRNNTLIALINCLADEAAARPETILAAVRQLIRLGSLLHGINSTPALVRGRYGAEFRKEAGKSFLSPDADLASSGDALLVAVWWQTLANNDPSGYKLAAQQLTEMLDSSVTLSRCEGATGLGWLCSHTRPEPDTDLIVEKDLVGGILVTMLDGTPAELCAALYALSALSNAEVWTTQPNLELDFRIFQLWTNHPNSTIRSLAGRFLSSHPLRLRENNRWFAAIPLEAFEDHFRGYGQMSDPDKCISLIVAWHIHALEDATLRHYIVERLDNGVPTLYEGKLQTLKGMIGGELQ
ncbi:MAG: hypothetical protein QOE33_762 [Acidobacteriota bacterium]|nr:hypothetical protein [Acidobacteriota bacterium]